MTSVARRVVVLHGAEGENKKDYAHLISPSRFVRHRIHKNKADFFRISQKPARESCASIQAQKKGCDYSRRTAVAPAVRLWPWQQQNYDRQQFERYTWPVREISISTSKSSPSKDINLLLIHSSITMRQTSPYSSFSRVKAPKFLYSWTWLWIVPCSFFPLAAISLPCPPLSPHKRTTSPGAIALALAN